MNGLRPEPAVARVLIYRLGSLGDTVVALPALRLVAKAFPNARRTMLTNFSVSAKAAPVAEILEHTGLVQDYIEYPLRIRGLGAALALRRRIRAARPDVAVYMLAPRDGVKTLRDAAFLYACGVPRVVGVPYRAAGRQRLRLASGRYEYEGARLLRCLRALGDQPLDAAAFDLALSPDERGTAARLAGADDVPMLAVSLGAKTDVKDWGDDNWRRLIAGLGAMLPGWRLLVLGAAVERARSDALAAFWPGQAINLCGSVCVREAAAVLAMARLYIGHDSGPMHLAACVGTPFVAIFSAQNLPGEWFPPGDANRILYHEIACAGCRLTECAVHAKACIMSITVPEAMAAAAALLRLSR